MKLLVEYEIAGENKVESFECAKFFDRYRPKGTKPGVTLAAAAIRSITLEEDGDELEGQDEVERAPVIEPVAKTDE